MKRAFDFCLACFGLLIIWPVLLVVALLIVLDDRGPVFFRQLRVGRFGKPFRMWKFRTMVVDAEKIGAQITVGRDPRITRIGEKLRKTKVDELPQLFNVVTGEMSFVGPRPEVPRYVELYTEEQRTVLDLMPGITDPASLRYRDENDVLAQAADPERLYREDIMPEKIRLNLDYAADAGLGRDIGVILQTIRRMFR